MTHKKNISSHEIHTSLFEEAKELPEKSRKIINNIMAYYNEIIYAMPGNVYWLDNQTNAVGCNKNVLDLLNLKFQNDFKGLSFEEMAKLGQWNPSQTKSFISDTQAVLDSGVTKANIEEPPILGPNGHDIYFLTTRVPLKNKQNKVIGVVGISTDITQQKLQEQELKKAKNEAEQANKVKTEFLENMRHDLRTPLSNMVNLSQLLYEKTKTDDVNLLAKDLLESSQQLNYLIDEILNLSEFSTNEVAQQLKIFSFKELFEKIYILLKASIDEKENITLNISIDPNIPEQLFGQYQAYRTILMNLIDNAIKFTEKGEVNVSLKLISQHNLDVDILIEISDSGIGIAKDKQDIIFNKFERLTPSYQSKHIGSGIGLYIVRQYAHAIGASIKLESEPGQGTTFRLKTQLTAVCTKKPVESAVKKTIHQDKQKLQTINQSLVLIIEDNLISQKVSSLMLEELGVPHHIANTGKEALKLIKENSFNLIFMDIGLPDMHGFDLCQKIRRYEINNMQTPVPIVALTAHIGKSEIKQCLTAGAQQVVIKPLHKNNVHDLIAHWLTD